MTSISALQERLKQIEIDIQDARQRLPAHSVKPVMMAALFDLEDEREAILQQLKALSVENEDQPPCPSK